MLFICLAFISLNANAVRLLIPMDGVQKNHLKSYGLSFWVLKKDLEVNWLLNYRGGSFMIAYNDLIEKECKIRGITYEIISEGQVTEILTEISKPDVNMEMVRLLKAPKIAVYSPKTKQPWDDAVTLVLTYAEIPYDVVYDDELLMGKLSVYDWLHVHHEDFTGQFGKFYSSFSRAAWYQAEVK
jgi:hypothetical protein